MEAFEFDPNIHQHRRYNPLQDEWILVSPHRMNRPWKGQVEKNVDEDVDNDPRNPLCPGGTRPNSIVNPFYTETFIFENDFPAILETNFVADESQKGQEACDNNLIRCEPARGSCYVMCFHPKSNVTLSTMLKQEVIKVISKWMELSESLKNKYSWIQIFENKGAIMGCSNPHPHCQVWASSFLPSIPNKKDEMQRRYYQKHGSVLLLDYLKHELKNQERIIINSEFWVCLVPYWALWPYETYIVPKRHVLRLQDLTEAESSDLADVMQKLLCKYDNLFHTSFPYSMGWHGAPTGKYLNEDCTHWQLHAMYLPPLLRSATVKKFMVGYEMLAEPQRDLTAEKAAEILRNMSDVHYKKQEETK